MITDPRSQEGSRIFGQEVYTEDPRNLGVVDCVRGDDQSQDRNSGPRYDGHVHKKITALHRGSVSDDLCQLGQSIVVLAIGQLSVVGMPLMPPFEGGHGVSNYESTDGLDRDSLQLLMRNACSSHGGSRRVIELNRQSLAHGVRVQNSSLTSHGVTLRAEVHARRGLRSSGKRGERTGDDLLLAGLAASSS